MLETTITLRDLLVALLFIAGTGALVYFMLAMKRLVDVLRGVERVIAANEQAIVDTLKSVPAITDNAASITQAVRKDLEESGDSLPAIMRNIAGITGSVDGALKGVHNTVAGISDTVGVVQSSARDIGSYIEMGAGVASTLARFLPAGKKKKKKRRLW